MLNNYNLNIENIMFWLNNEELIVRFYNIENGKFVETTNGSKLIPLGEETNIETIMFNKFGVNFNKNEFINYVNRYVNPFSNNTSLSMNKYPIPIEIIFKLVSLDKASHNIEMINSFVFELYSYYKTIDDYILDSIIDFYKIESNNNFDNYIEQVLTKFSDKVFEYKSGKVNLINLFFGEIMKSLPNKNIDKTNLMDKLKYYLDGE